MPMQGVVGQGGIIIQREPQEEVLRWRWACKCVIEGRASKRAGGEMDRYGHVPKRGCEH